MNCIAGILQHLNVAAWSKGRSRSRALNRLLKRAAPEALACGIRLGFGYVRSAFNPADNPTRGRAVRGVPVYSAASDSELGRLLAGERLSESELGQLFGEEVDLPDARFRCGERAPPGAWSDVADSHRKSGV